jgi:hypothetical protein
MRIRIVETPPRIVGKGLLTEVPGRIHRAHAHPGRDPRRTAADDVAQPEDRAHRRDGTRTGESRAPLGDRDVFDQRVDQARDLPRAGAIDDLDRILAFRRGVAPR